jgi:hypothetical protein
LPSSVVCIIISPWVTEPSAEAESSPVTITASVADDAAVPVSVSGVYTDTGSIIASSVVTAAFAIPIALGVTVAVNAPSFIVIATTVATAVF